MRTSVLILIFYMFCGVNSFSQESIPTSLGNKKSMQAKSALYIEFLGNSATVFSINYDRIIKEYDDSYLNMTIGYGNYLGLDARTGFNIPFSINYTFGKTTNHHFELGLGGGLNFLTDDNSSRMLLSSRIGYKYQKPNGGFYIRTALTPIFPFFYFNYPEGRRPSTIFYDTEDSRSYRDLEFFLQLIGISIGYSF